MLPVAQRLHDALDRRPWVAPVLFALLAAVVLLVRLGQPERIYFDETYYVDDALGYLDDGIEPSFAVHPPVGKWLIAATITLVGDQPFGWRLAGALAGVGTVVLTYLLARRLLRGTPTGWWLALLAPVLLLADGLFLTQSRIAMLDASLVLLSTGALYLLVVDHDDRGERAAAGLGPRRPSLRVVVGILLGLAIAVKWSGLLALGAAGLLTLAWELRATRGQRRQLTGRALAVLGSLVLVPVAVYAVSWIPWLAGYDGSYADDCPEDEVCGYTVGQRLAGLADHHDEMLHFHLTLEATHRYRSDPLGWPVLERPVSYYYESCDAGEATAAPTIDEDTGELTPVCEVAEGQSGEVLALGNPALWWGFLLLTPLLVGGTVLRDRRSAVPLVGWLSLWLPWLVVSRAAFLFYMAPAVPLMAIGVVVAMQRLGDPAPVRRTYLSALVGGGLGLAVAGGLVLITPLAGLTGVWLTGAAGWALGSAMGAVADRQARWTVGRHAAGSTAGRWAIAATVLAVGLAVFFAPVWYGIPLDSEMVRLRWWFDTWV